MTPTTAISTLITVTLRTLRTTERALPADFPQSSRATISSIAKTSFFERHFQVCRGVNIPVPPSRRGLVKSSQVNTLPKAKSKTRSKENKDMHKCSSVHSERGVPLPVLTSGGE
jgi:hypothetical protein